MIIRDRAKLGPRKAETYRWWRRNNALEWKGVTPDRIEEKEIKKRIRKEDRASAKEG